MELPASASPLLLAALLAVLLPLVLRLLSGSSKRRAPTTLQPTAQVELKLVHRENVSHDTRLFRFALPTAKHVLGLPIGQHVMISCKDAKGEEIARPYTPVSSDDDVGHVDLVIKIYFRGVNEKFPDGGVMSQHMESLKLGDSARVQLLYFPMPLLLIRNNHVVQLMFQGPKGKYTYKGRGTFGVKRLPSQGGGEELRKCRRIGMIAGGTGITPMLQIINAVLKDQGDKTELSLLFANQTEDDILCRKELEALAAKHSKLKLHYTLDRPPKAGWQYSTGFINADLVKKTLPPPGPDTQILVCGPPPMIKFACRPAFEQLGYTDGMLMIW